MIDEPNNPPVAAASAAASADEPIELDGDDSGEDVWEDGGIGDQEEQTVEHAVEQVAAFPPPAEEESSSEEEEGDWEDGAVAEVEEAEQGVEVDMNSTVNLDIFTASMFVAREGSDGQAKEDGISMGVDDVSNLICPPAPAIRDGQAEAFASAQADAAKMGSWIGRAVERGIRDFRKEMGVEPEPPAKPATASASAPESEAEAEFVETLAPAPPAPPRPSIPVKPATEEDLAEFTAQRKQIQQEMNKHTRDADTVTPEMKSEVIELLELFGIPYVVAPSEAEAQCATLEMLGLVDGIITEDSDVFVFGGKTVYRNVFDSNKNVEVYMSSDAENELALKREQFVSLAMLLGGDYTSGVKGVGIVNGMEVLTAFNVSSEVAANGDGDATASYDPTAGLQKFKEWLDGFDPTDLAKGNIAVNATMSLQQKFHQKHKNARQRWEAPHNFPAKDALQGYLRPVVDSSTEQFSWGTPDMDELRLFCAERIGWDEEETNQQILPVLKKMAEPKERKIESYFRTYENKVLVGEVRSKRLQESLKAMTGGLVPGVNHKNTAADEKKAKMAEGNKTERKGKGKGGGEGKGKEREHKKHDTDDDSDDEDF